MTAGSKSHTTRAWEVSLMKRGVPRGVAPVGVQWVGAY